MASHIVLSQLPKFLIEAIAFGGILLLSLILFVRYDGVEGNALGQVLPLLGLYAFAGYRMLPAVQMIYQSTTQMRFGGAAIDSLYANLLPREILPPIVSEGAHPLVAKNKVVFEEVYYTYPNSSNVGIKGIALNIPVGSTLGVVGTTGAGKTTLVDLFLGLLRPNTGCIKVDDVVVTDDNLRHWQANIGYVPQNIFLIDASIAANIAMGVDDPDIDQNRVKQCAHLAQLAEFVESELPEGYATTVGERGVRLSGGQRQRIGIARALYHDPEIIVFDEATSALDNSTEKDVMTAIGNLHGSKTIVIIAHRLSTVKICDQIAVLDKGHLVGLGTYDDLAANNPAFRKISEGT